MRALEFGTPSITSANYSEYVGIDTVAMAERGFLQTNPHLSYVNLSDHGYGILELNKSGGAMKWYYVNNLHERSDQESLAKSIEFSIQNLNL